jgi:hypothetical protein
MKKNLEEFLKQFFLFSFFFRLILSEQVEEKLFAKILVESEKIILEKREANIKKKLELK